VGKLYLVDGTFELFRCFHGAPRRRDAGGTEIGAARALLWTLVKLSRRADATHIGVAFDRMAPGRGAGSELTRQGALAVDVARALGFVVWPMTRYQADDAMASAAARFEDAPGIEQVVIATRDKDLLQCVRGERVVHWDRVADRWTDAMGLVDRLGVAPEQVPAFLALVGDPSDGIPGIPGFGSVSVARLLTAYGSLEEAYARRGDWRLRGALRLCRSLEQRWDEALLFRNLSRLRADLPLPQVDVEQLRWRGARRSQLLPLVARLEVTEALEKIRLFDIRAEGTP
jgi:5'-3' exonuclease